ncbi:hypothetical protein JKA62_26195 [Pseudomonas sp. B7]|uniref:Uncharacterized protein n=1 Tax=Pseudomonas fluorescens (strain Pf0-1) TaxID=205922 RepID=Q3KDX6_PSEPF|nr:MULTISPECIES: hypothetical protein [Pseudomonas]ABA74030.1 hypothetical protein Pfl01_2287 [Pseudomonas fluorescens Pf0-1]MBL0798589.1 hypothetical protein [Pseudomonas sp. B7]MBY9026826.1 hypothetical protein [Pseudomonas fluorescens]MBY9032436.1 hypothetical protein [Pseudomonas fluorescens]MBY9038800.1 hypothetical protein [Pseudomonas fluorescens]
MSKLGCRCGHVIVDQTDSLPYKASLLRDEVEDAFWEEVNQELKPLMTAAESGDKAVIDGAFGEFAPWVNATDELISRLSSLHIHRTLDVYECTNCGRLWVQKGAGNQFVSYVPEEGGYQAILSATSGDSESLDCE